MLLFPNAKINLGLNILRKRPDGYHDIETVFYPVNLTDALEVVPSVVGGSCNLHLSGIHIGGDPAKNLAVKAYDLLAVRFELPPVDVYLHKVIPFGAGLGGGSSDAAYMLLMLRDSFKLPLSDDDLSRYASQLGADCAFFIRNRPMLAHGIGDEMEEIGITLSGYSIVLVKPAVMVSTPEAYAGVTPRIPEVTLSDIIKLPIREWQGRLVNDFEPSVFAKYPQISKVKDDMYRMGALYASMSGSGSSVFGIFEQIPEELSLYFVNDFVYTGECRF